MQVSDTKKHEMEEVDIKCRTLTPVTVLLTIFGLNYNVQSSRRPFCRILMMAVIFGSMSIFVMYYKIRYLGQDLNVSVRLTDYLQTVYDYCQYGVDLLYVHKFGRRYYREYFMQFRTIDKIIGTGTCITIRKKLIKLVTFFILIWLVTSTLDFAAWVTNYGWFIPTVYSVSYLYFFVKILNNLDMTSQTMHFEVRLRIIGDLVQSYNYSVDTIPGVTHDSLSNNWFYTSTKLRIKEREVLKKSATNGCHEIRWLSRSYLLLTELSTFVNRMFGIRILLNCLSLLIDMVRFTNLAVRIATGSQHTLNPTNYYYFPVVSTASRLLTCMIILVSLVSHCQKVYTQTDRIIRITDHLLLNKRPDPLMRAAIIELRGLVQQRPINFHLANFLRLDYSMLLSTASVVVTYTIILLQSIN